MATQRLNLTRDQLATFLKNHEQIKQFEKLFEMVEEMAVDDTKSISIQAGNADTKATQALDSLARIANALELLAAQPVIQNHSALAADYVDFHDHGWSPAFRTGRAAFGPTGTLNLGMGNGIITQHVGEQLFRYGRASSAVSATNLQAVYKTGVVGSSGVITFAPTIAGLNRADQFVGLAAESISTNAFGRVIRSGVIRGINTTGSVYGEVWADNDDIFYNPVTGGLTKTMPVAPNMKLRLGTVINASAGGSGSFIVNYGVASSLGSTDSDVQISSVSDYDLLVYDSALGYWQNKPASVVQVLEWMSM